MYTTQNSVAIVRLDILECETEMVKGRQRNRERNIAAPFIFSHVLISMMFQSLSWVIIEDESLFWCVFFNSWTFIYIGATVGKLVR